MPIWAWQSVGWTVFALGVLIAALSLFWDRSKGRQRCPKCWYDMSDAQPEAQPIASIYTCPECGKQTKSHKHLLKAHRRWRIAIPMLLAAWLGWYTQAAAERTIQRGWNGAVPTWVIAASTPLLLNLPQNEYTDEEFAAWTPNPVEHVNGSKKKTPFYIARIGEILFYELRRRISTRTDFPFNDPSQKPMSWLSSRWVSRCATNGYLQENEDKSKRARMLLAALSRDDAIPRHLLIKLWKHEVHNAIILRSTWPRDERLIVWLNDCKSFLHDLRGHHNFRFTRLDDPNASFKIYAESEPELIPMCGNAFGLGEPPPSYRFGIAKKEIPIKVELLPSDVPNATPLFVYEFSINLNTCEDVTQAAQVLDVSAAINPTTLFRVELNQKKRENWWDPQLYLKGSSDLHCDFGDTGAAMHTKIFKDGKEIANSFKIWKIHGQKFHRDTYSGILGMRFIGEDAWEHAITNDDLEGWTISFEFDPIDGLGSFGAESVLQGAISMPLRDAIYKP